MINDYIQSLETEFIRNANPDIAKGQKAYMKHKFDFFGLQSVLRRQIQKPFMVQAYLPEKKEGIEIIKMLWQKPQREFQYFAQELLEKYQKEYQRTDIEFFEYLITHKSWWDTVDFISQKIVGKYFLRFPEDISSVIPKWVNSGNLWLQRTALIFQLKYKEKTDVDLLEKVILGLKDTDEFFLNKAIGWALREYGKTRPDWVADFVAKTRLHPLSEREAMRIILKK